MGDPYYGGGLLEKWSKGLVTPTPAPLAVRSRWYRKLVRDILIRSLEKTEHRILSIGSGTGIMEAELSASGFHILASDIDEAASKQCVQAGLAFAYFDISSDTPPNFACDALYIDGVLGHLPTDTNWAKIWSRLHSTGARLALLSNDLSDDDAAENFGVHGNAEAYFCRPAAGKYELLAIQSGHWQACWKHILKYRRPGRGIRRRELLLLNSATGVQTGGR